MAPRRWTGCFNDFTWNMHHEASIFHQRFSVGLCVPGCGFVPFTFTLNTCRFRQDCNLRVHSLFFLMVCPHLWMFDSSTGAYWSPQRYHWNFTFSDENTLALLASARAPSARFNSSFEWRQTQNWVNTQSPLSMKFGCLSCVWRSKLWFSTTIPGPSLLFSCSKIMNFWRHSLTLGEVMEKWWIRTKILFQMIKSKIFHRFMSVHVYIAYFLTKTHQIHLHR